MKRAAELYNAAMLDLWPSDECREVFEIKNQEDYARTQRMVRNGTLTLNYLKKLLKDKLAKE